MISFDDKKTSQVSNRVIKRSMRNFTTTYWNETLATLKFLAPSISGVVDINALANELAENLTKALDTVAPMKSFTIRQNYIHGLTDEAKQIMKSRDYMGKLNCLKHGKQFM